MRTYHIITFGCQMNTSDSERIASMCEKCGLKVTKDINKADLIIINSCSVRQKAEDRVIGLGPKVEKFKIKNSKLKVVLTGCMATRKERLKSPSARPADTLSLPKSKLDSLRTSKSKQDDFRYKRSLHQRLPWVDFIIDIKDISQIPSFLQTPESRIQIPHYLGIHPLHSSSSQAFVPISTGCNNFCSYCIVPYARGEERHRRATDIIKEVKALVKKGYKDITLLGQNVNSWKSKTSPKTFPELLRNLNHLKGDFWLTFFTSHPKDMNAELINVVAKGKHIRSYIHFALQSGNNKILKKMNRKYTVEHFSKIVKIMRKRIPNVAISTDIIVGFPGETDKQFQDTVTVMKALKFDMAYISEYSPRPGTAAAKLEDNISHEVKEKRKKLLTKILAKTALENNKKKIGKEERVLVMKMVKKKKSQFYIGKTKNFKDVKIKRKSLKIGEFNKVKITAATSWGLEGVLV